MTTATPTESTAPPEEKLSFWRKIGYGVGDIYGGGTAVILSFYYLVFLTDVIRLNPALAGTVILISKLYDSVTDPFEGVLSDRTRTKLGRRRPYLLAGIPLVFLSFFALFYPVDFEQESSRFVFVICTYLFFSTIVSIVMLNYNALQSELSLDYDERTSLSSARIFFSALASIVCALVPMEIVKASSDVHQGYIVMGLVFGAFFAIPYIFTFLSARERKEFQKPPEKLNLRDNLIEPFRVRSFVIVLLMFVFASIATDTVSSVVVYFMKYHMGRGDEANYVAGTMLVFQVIALGFFAAYSRRTSKRRAFILGLAIWMVTMLFSLFLGPESPFIFVYIFAACVGIGLGGYYVSIYAIFPDLPDVDELRTGERREGIFGALITLTRKFSGAIGIFIVSNVIGWAGYARPVEQVVDGVTKLIDQPQSDQFVLVLRVIFVVVPLVLLSLAIFTATRLPLNHQTHAELNRVLAVRRSGVELTPELQNEADELTRRLIG
ncbi:MAG TPA: MFS transporter [Chloroflexi bacterium]|nr:MFS transporter [Chloroflexota bacterium]